MFETTTLINIILIQRLSFIAGTSMSQEQLDRQLQEEIERVKEREAQRKKVRDEYIEEIKGAMRRKQNTPKKTAGARKSKKSIKAPKSKATKAPRKKPRAGSKVDRDIARYQRLFHGLLIPEASMLRLIREIAPSNIRFQRAAIEALREASERRLVELFQDGNLCAEHAKRKTLMPKDVQLAKYLESHN